MTHILILYLHSLENIASSTVSWRSLSVRSYTGSASSSGATMTGSFDDFLVFYKKIRASAISKINIEKSPPIYLMIPGRYVTYSMVKVPDDISGKNKFAIPYLIEDFLASDIESVRISIGKRTSDGKLPVAIVDKNTIQHILSVFDECDISLKSISTFEDVINKGESDLLVVLYGDNALIKSRELCLQLNIENLPKIKSLVFDGNNKKIKFLYQEGEAKHSRVVSSIKSGYFDIGKNMLEIQTYSGDIFDLFSNKNQSDYINLLNDFSNSEAYPAWVSKISDWKPLWISILVIAVIQISWNYMAAHFLSLKSDQILRKSHSYYMSIFPDDTVSIENFETSWFAKVSEYGAPDSREGFPYLFHAISVVIFQKTDFPHDVLIRQFSYDETDGELSMSVDVKSIATLEGFKSELISNEIDMKILSANEDKNVIRASVLLKPL